MLEADKTEKSFKNTFYYAGMGVFPGGSDGKEAACQCREQGLIPRSGRSPVGRHGNPLQHSRLGNSMDRGGWQATVGHNRVLHAHAGTG